MADIIRNYMTVSMDLQPEGINLACWMSTVEFWTMERLKFPFLYTHVGDRCTWVIHSNNELTLKAVSMVVETADRICVEQAARNDRRKLSNR